MTKQKTKPSAFDDILNSAKSESAAVKNIINNKSTEDTDKKIKEVKQQLAAPEETNNKLIIKPPSKETRSKKTNILLTPALDKAVKEKAQNEGVSLNEVVNQLLEMWLNA